MQSQPKGSTWWQPYASDWCQFEKKRLNSSCPKEDHENIIVESQRIRTTKNKEKTHIADRGQVSMSHYNMVHKLVSISNKTVEISAANVPMDRDWRKWRMNQVSLCCMVINTTLLPCWSNTTATITFTTHISFGFVVPSKRGASMENEILHSIHPWNENKEFVSVMVSTRQISRFGGRPMAQPYIHFWRVRRENLDYVHKAQRRLQSWGPKIGSRRTSN